MILTKSDDKYKPTSALSSNLHSPVSCWNLPNFQEVVDVLTNCVRSSRSQQGMMSEHTWAFQCVTCYKLPFYGHQHTYLLAILIWSSYTNVCFNHRIAIFRTLHYIKIFQFLVIRRSQSALFMYFNLFKMFYWHIYCNNQGRRSQYNQNELAIVHNVNFN